MNDTPPDTGSDRNGTDRDTRTGQDTLNTDTMQWVSALAAIVGLWLVASPFVLESTETAIWTITLSGTAIFLLAGSNFLRMSRDRLASTGVAALTVVVGLWMLVSPAVIEMGSSELATSTAISGLAVAALSGYNAYANNAADTTDARGARA